MMPVFISFHTPEQRYVEASKRLEASLKMFGLPYEIRTLPSLGCWNKNDCIKAEFILAMLQSYPYQKEMIWIDADAEIVQYPKKLEDIKGDVAAVVNEHGLYASLVYFRNIPRVRRLVREWVRANNENPYEFTGDQFNLDALLKVSPWIYFEELPREYSSSIHENVENPVILQHQVSNFTRKEFTDCPHCMEGMYGTVVV
jgi:hypothetical protein